MLRFSETVMVNYRLILFIKTLLNFYFIKIHLFGQFQENK